MMDDQDPTVEQRRVQAGQWFARLKTVPVSKGTLDDFFEWRRDPANAEAFAQAELLWGDAGRLGESPAILRLTKDAFARRGPGRPASRWATRPTLALGLGVILALGFASWWMLRPEPALDLATHVGEQKALALADGSQLRLDTDTQIEVAMARSAREIRLDHGQAMFEVAHDERRPFRVKAGAVEVEATGTRFDVRHLDGATQVSLFEGGVTIRSTGHPPLRLKPGEQWRSNADGAVRLSQMRANHSAAWTQGRVVFDATPLGAAVEEMNRYSARKLVLVAPTRRTHPISGSFTTRDSSGFIKAVSAMFALQVDERPDGNVILREAPPSRN